MSGCNHLQSRGLLAGAWVFRTSEPPRIVGDLPRHGASGVPVDTGIEVTFDQDGVGPILPLLVAREGVTAVTNAEPTSVNIAFLLNDLRLDVHADLCKMVVPRKLDRAWPDRFFRKGTSAKPAVTEDAPVGPTPAPQPT